MDSTIPTRLSCTNGPRMPPSSCMGWFTSVPAQFMPVYNSNQNYIYFSNLLLPIPNKYFYHQFKQILHLFYRFFMARCGGFNGGVALICGGGYDLGLRLHLRFRLFCAMQARMWVLPDLGVRRFLVVSLII